MDGKGVINTNSDECSCRHRTFIISNKHGLFDWLPFSWSRSRAILLSHWRNLASPFLFVTCFSSSQHACVCPKLPT